MINFENYKSVFKNTGIFKGFNNFDLISIIGCMGAIEHNVKKRQIVLLAGDKPDFIAVVLSGKFHVIREDYNGNRSLLAVITPGRIFAEVLCCAGLEQSPFTVIAAENSCYMKLNFSRVIKTCSKSCANHKRLIENMTSLLAKKNIMLQRRMEILELKTIREKVMRYFESFEPPSPPPNQVINLPFNREEMADFLCVDRSALSHELIKMRKERLIDFNKNQFTIFYN